MFEGAVHEDAVVGTEVVIAGTALTLPLFFKSAHDSDEAATDDGWGALLALTGVSARHAYEGEMPEFNAESALVGDSRRCR